MIILHPGLLKAVTYLNITKITEYYDPLSHSILALNIQFPAILTKQSDSCLDYR